MPDGDRRLDNRRQRRHSVAGASREDHTFRAGGRNRENRKLVRRRDEHSVGVKAADDHPLAVNRLRHHLKAVCRDAIARRCLGRIFNGDAGSPARLERTHQKIDALRGSLDNHDLGRVGNDPTRAAEMIGEHVTQGTLSASVPVVEDGRPTTGDTLRGSKPSREREQRHIRPCRTQVIARLRGWWVGFGSNSIARLDLSDNWRFALPAEQETLSLKLVIGITDNAPRDAELLSQRA